MSDRDYCGERIKGVSGDLRRSKIRATRGGDQGGNSGYHKGSVIRDRGRSREDP